MSEEVTRINPSSLPDSGRVGYSQISIADPGRLAFVSGQVAWRAQGQPAPGTLAEQAVVVVGNLTRALEALAVGPDAIVHMRIYVVDLTPERQAVAMPALMEFLDGARPSLTGIGVRALAAPELQLEIEMVVRV